MKAPVIDFMQPRATRRLGWVVLGAGSVALATSLWAARAWDTERTQRESALRRHEEAAQQARRAALGPAPLSADERRRQRIAPRLRQPWLPTLRLIENVTEPPLFLLALRIDPATGTVRLEGEAPGFEQALAYAQSLDEQGLLGPAELLFHEQVSDPAGMAAVRFTIATRWSVR